MIAYSLVQGKDELDGCRCNSQIIPLIGGITDGLLAETVHSLADSVWLANSSATLL